ncbi:hypothetical protein, partial [Noviherbaspirillum agri]
PETGRLLCCISLPWPRHDASPRLAFDRFPGLRACQKDTEQALNHDVMTITREAPSYPIV